MTRIAGTDEIGLPSVLPVGLWSPKQENTGRDFDKSIFEAVRGQGASCRISTAISAIAHRARDYSGSVMKGSQSTDVPLVDADLMRSLPPGHFPGGVKYKGQVMLMPDIPPEYRFVPEKRGRLKIDPQLRSGDPDAQPTSRLQLITLYDNPRWYDGSEIAHVPFVAN